MPRTKYTKQKNGYFQTRVWDGTYKQGKKNYVIIRTKKSSADLEKMVARHKQSVEERKYLKDTDIAFFEYAQKWLEVYKASRAENTKEMYANIINKHLNALELIKLQEVDRIHLQTVLNNASGKKRTQEQIVLTFKQILKSAVIDQLYPANVAENIFNNIEKVQYKAPEKRALTSYEKEAVFSCDLNLQDRAFLYILYGCGLRRAEVMALTKDDINLDKKELVVNKAVSMPRNTPSEKEPKTPRGNRTVPMPNKIYPTIEELVKERLDSTHLFIMKNGKQMSKSSYDKMWERILRAMQIACDGRYKIYCELRDSRELEDADIEREAGLAKSTIEDWRTGRHIPHQETFQKVAEFFGVPVGHILSGEVNKIEGLTAHVFRHNYCANLCYQIPTISIKKIAQLLGDTDKMVLEVYNHIILEKEDAVLAVENALDF